MAALEAALDVAHLEDLFHPLGMMRPDAREEIGLKLQADRQLVGPRLVGPALHGVDLVTDAQQVLDVMTDLVGDHVSLGEIARGPEFLLQLLKEAQVEVNLLIGRAVKRPDGRAGLAAG